MTPYELGRSSIRVASWRGKAPRRARGRHQILPGIESLEGRLLLASSLTGMPLEIVSTYVPAPRAGSISHFSAVVSNLPSIAISSRPILGALSNLVAASRSRTLEPAPLPEMVLRNDSSSDESSPLVDLVSSPWQPIEPDSDHPADELTLVPASALSPLLSKIEDLPPLLNRPELHLIGVVGPDQDQASFRVALSPSTERVKIRVARDPSSTEPGTPIIEDIVMIGVHGEILSTILGTYERWHDTPSEMTLSLSHVPRGANLVFRVIQAPLNVDPSSGSSPSFEGDLAFTLDLSRTEAAGPLPTPPQADLASVWLTMSPVLAGLYSPPGMPGASLPRTITSPSTIGGDETSTSSVEMPSGELAVYHSLVADGLPGVSVGPLISRGATPVGPSLATAPGALTEPVDRNERAFDLASGSSEGGEAVPVMTSAAEQVAAASAAGTLALPSKGSGEYSEDLLLVRGPGGLPILATSASKSHHRGDPEALIATLPITRRAVAAEAEQEVDAPARADDVRSHSQPKKLGLFALIFGILVGITLTSRPFYPDLLALVRIRLFGTRGSGPRGRKSGGSRWGFRKR